jgi:hypothetical protein
MTGRRPTRWRVKIGYMIDLHGSGPSTLTDPRFHLIIFRFRTSWSANGGAWKVHVRGHRRRIHWATGIRIAVVRSGTRGRHASMCRRRPTKTGHMGTSSHTVRPVIVVGWRFKRLWGPVIIWMGGQGRPDMRAAAKARKGRRRGGRRSPGTGLGEITSHMRRNRSVAYVVVT